MNAKLKVICLGIRVKLNRGEELETVLDTYTKLTAEEKQIIRDELSDNKASEV